MRIFKKVKKVSNFPSFQGKYDTSDGFQRLQAFIDEYQKESNNREFSTI